MVGAMLALLLLLSLLATQAPSPAPAAVVCRSLGLEPARMWTFEPVQDTWRVTHQAEGASRRATLVLPNVQATFTADAVSLRSRTANGGIDVTLSGTPDKATLDAYVNYELEVNVDAALTPDMDDIDTDGPVGVSCEPTRGGPAARRHH
jgi:hypothetical protein